MGPGVNLEWESGRTVNVGLIVPETGPGHPYMLRSALEWPLTVCEKPAPYTSAFMVPTSPTMILILWTRYREVASLSQAI